jgi:large subunit ribosomal protein LP2
MKELAAYLLAVLGGKAGSAKDVKAILSAAGVEADSDAVDQVLAAVDGKVSK